MKRRELLTCVAVALLALAPASPQTRRPEPSIENKIDGIFADVSQNRSPGVAVLVRKNGRTVLQRGYGVRDLRTGAPIDPDTNFRLASCSKEFTAMAVMLLVHDGKLRYEQRLTDIFPDFPEYGKQIMIRHLLNHTSGLPDYEELMEQTAPGQPPRWTETPQITDAEVLNLLA